MPTIGPIELIVVLIIALVILGPKRLPAAGRSLGDGLREFRDGVAGRGASAAMQAPRDERDEDAQTLRVHDAGSRGAGGPRGPDKPRGPTPRHRDTATPR